MDLCVKYVWFSVVVLASLLSVSSSDGADLPVKCFNPKGNCSWYRECLEEAYPCSGCSSAYALEYGEHYCQLFTESYHSFSQTGQQWLNATRLCLQLELVPFLEQKESTCDGILDKAFASHTSCYLNPDVNSPSVCDLSCLDVLNLIWIIKSDFVSRRCITSLRFFTEVTVACATQNPTRIAKCTAPVWAGAVLFAGRRQLF